MKKVREIITKFVLSQREIEGILSDWIGTEGNKTLNFSFDFDAEGEIIVEIIQSEIET